VPPRAKMVTASATMIARIDDVISSD